MLERQTFGLVNEAVHEERTDQAERAPDEEHLGSEVGIARASVDHVGCGIGNGPVEQPVSGRRHGKAFGTCFEWEYLTRDDPCFQLACVVRQGRGWGLQYRL